jgi:hypothetical protein
MTQLESIQRLVISRQAHLCLRNAYAEAMTSGKDPQEWDPEGKASEESRANSRPFGRSPLSVACSAPSITALSWWQCEGFPSESTVRFRGDRAGHLNELARKAARWVDAHEGALLDTDPASALRTLPDRPWATWSHGRPITAASIARLLKNFKIFPNTLKHQNVSLERMADA